MGGSVFDPALGSVVFVLGLLWCDCPGSGGASIVKLEDAPSVFVSSNANQSSLRAVLRIVSSSTSSRRANRRTSIDRIEHPVASASPDRSSTATYHASLPPPPPASP